MYLTHQRHQTAFQTAVGVDLQAQQLYPLTQMFAIYT